MLSFFSGDFCFFLEQTRLLPKLLFVFFLFFWLFCIFCLAKKGEKTANTEYLRILFVVSRCLVFVSFSPKKHIGALQHHQDFQVPQVEESSPETLGDIFRYDHVMKKKFLDGPDFGGSHQYI